MDEELRNLERRATTGDLDAERQAAAMRERMAPPKPITAVMSYRDVEGYTRGLQIGPTRKVLILGEVFSCSGTAHKACDCKEKARTSYAQSLENLDPAQIHEFYFYLGAQGVGVGYDTLRKMARPGMCTTLVACDCGLSAKQRFADEQNLPIIWSECGGYATLARIVRQVLET